MVVRVLVWIPTPLCRQLDHKYLLVGFNGFLTIDNVGLHCIPLWKSSDLHACDLQAAYDHYMQNQYILTAFDCMCVAHILHVLINKVQLLFSQKVCNLYTFQMQKKNIQIPVCNMLTWKTPAMDYMVVWYLVHM